MSHFVYSTLTNDQCYITWRKAEFSAHAEPEHKVLIRGGANRATKSLVTPHGTVTEISDKDFGHLKTNEVFQRHEKGGFIKVMANRVDPEVAAADDMDLADDSAPATPQTFADAREQDAKPKEDKPEKKNFVKRLAGLGDRE